MKVAVFSILLLVSTLAAQPTTRIVPTHYATIQAAIDAAGTGDTVLVLPGTYIETISFLGKALTVRSRDGAVVTTIDGNRQGTVVFMYGSGAPVLEGFTITGGNGHISGTAGYAGGVSCSATGGIIRDNIITGNRIDVLPQPGSHGRGGGIYCSGCAPQILRNTITNNSCTVGWGGGIYLSSSGGTALIKGNTIGRNSGLNGGGLYIKGIAIVEENVFSGNRVSGGRYSPAPRGGGVLCEGQVTLRNNVIASNDAMGGVSGNGGGVYCEKLSGMLSGNIITGNSALSGGGVFVFGMPTVITANLIIGNSADSGSARPGGGGIYAYDAIITSNLIANNTSGSYGGGVACMEDVVFVNNTVAGNSAATAGGGYYTWNVAPHPIVNAIFWNNTAPSSPQIGGSTLPVVTWSDVQGGWSGTGNLALDPGFADPAAIDFHLLHSSPCKEAGDPSAVGLPMTDFEGDPRLVDGKVAMGADAFYPHLYHTGTPTPGSTIRVKTVGEPGEQVLWAYSITPAVYDPPLSFPGIGDFYLRTPFVPIFVGPVPATGIFSLSLSFPQSFPIPSTFPTQALVIGSSWMSLTNCDRIVVK